MIDLMDNEGKLKELNTHADDYASQYLSARHTYYVLKIESNSPISFESTADVLCLVDQTLGEKRYIPSFNLEQIDQKLMTIFTSKDRFRRVLNTSLLFRFVERLEQIETRRGKTESQRGRSISVQCRSSQSQACVQSKITVLFSIRRMSDEFSEIFVYRTDHFERDRRKPWKIDSLSAIEWEYRAK